MPGPDHSLGRGGADRLVGGPPGPVELGRQRGPSSRRPAQPTARDTNGLGSSSIGPGSIGPGSIGPGSIGPGSVGPGGVDPGGVDLGVNFAAPK
ncbi:hypothetical protein GCM10027614_21520 [Micromonospora vulcania]